MKTITTAKMIEMIRNQSGCTFATIESNTDPKAKKSCPFQKVEKITRQNVMIGFDYSNAVNNQRSREEIEAEFKSAPRRWGERVDLKTVEHKGNVYLTTATLNHYSTVYKADGEVVESDLIKPHLPKKSTSSRQGTEKEIVYRDFKAESIKEITMNNETYKVC